ncbi:MAG TPA: class I SAM-dependent methyltransferase [Bryobacteraceae bacterium]|nr:class I SAM-dependent methyltransferase [Bryobacteraceae bacterium]
MAAYDDFAWFYNRYWSEEFHAAAFPILERIWLPQVPAGGRVLDICCGTGYLARLLTDRGFRVTGVDESAAMIGYARENAPRAEFHVAGAAEFSLPGRFDAAVSTFDSLNHLIGADLLAAAFRRTAAALEPGAPFAFDILTEEAYQTHWGENFVLVRDDHVLAITGGGYDFRSRLSSCTITMFRRIAGEWRRSDAVVDEQAYEPREIDEALERAGFGAIVCYDARDLGMAGQLGVGRTFYVATKR